MTRLIHLNGPPGIGKSTLARRFVDEHPGVLNCDVDVLRSLVGGWQADFTRAGSLIRPAAVAMIDAYLRSGNDVIFPQLLVNPKELARFEQTATNAGATFVERVLMDSAAASLERFHGRGRHRPADPWHDQVRKVVADNGGDDLLAKYYSALLDLIDTRHDAVVIRSTEGAIDQTYRTFVDSMN